MRAIAVTPTLIALALLFTIAPDGGAADAPIPGKKLVLKARPEKPERRIAKVVATGPSIVIGAGNGSADDPVLAGGSLRIVSRRAGGFDDTYPLPASAWRYVGESGGGKGYKLTGASPVGTILVKTGRKLKIAVKGAALGHDLATTPEPVDVILNLGAHRLCLRFGTASAFKPGRKFLAKNTSAPAICGDAVTTTTSTTSPPGSSTSTSTGVPGSSTTSSTSVPTTSTTSTTSTTIFSSFTEAPPEVVARLDEVLAAATAILNGGGTFGDVMDFLAGEPDVTNVFVDGLTLEFTVAGLESALHDGQAARLRAALAAPSTGAPRGAALSTGPVPEPVAAGIPPDGQRVVGADRDLDGRRDVEKNAIVLSPYKFQFQGTDDGQPVAALLGARDDYMGRVQYHEASVKSASLLPMALWTSWMDYDVVHIVTHGDRNRLWLGDSTASCTTLAASIRSQIPGATQRAGLRCGSVNTAPANAAPVWDTDVSANPTFFSANYPSGLPRRLVFLNACRTTFASGLADALLGEDGFYVGWDEYVDSQFALNTATLFYQDTIARGFPVWRSFLRQCAGAACLNSATTLPSGQTKSEELEIAYDRADLRLRESLTVVQPFITGLCLEDPELPLSVTCPSCGDPFMGVFVGYGVVIDGFVPEDLALRPDPLEFALEQLRLFADADGEETAFAFPLFLNPGLTNVGDGQWQSDVQLFVGDVCPNDVVSYLPKLMLPAFDQGAGGNASRDFSYPLDGPWDLTFDTVPF